MGARRHIATLLDEKVSWVWHAPGPEDTESPCLLKRDLDSRPGKRQRYDADVVEQGRVIVRCP